MLNRTEEYRAVITGDCRRMLIKAIVDIVDPDIIYSAATSSSEAAFSRSEQLHDKNMDPPEKFVTLEADRWALDGTWQLMPADTSGHRICFVGDELCDSAGIFSPAAWVQQPFSNVSILQAFSVYFSTLPGDGYAVDFTVEVMCGGTAYFTKTITGNDQTTLGFEGFTVYNPDGIRVTVTRWSIGSRRLRIVEIIPGIYEDWRSDIIATLDISHEINPSCLSLPYGTCLLSMDNLSRRFEPRSKNGLFQSIEERQQIPVFIGPELPDGTAAWMPAGVYYQQSGGWTTGDNGLTMQWKLVDIVGLLADREFIPPATLPTTLNGWAAALVAQLGANFTDRYSVDASYASLSVTAAAEDIEGLTCGELARYAGMVTGTFPRADVETGYLCFEPTWSAGSSLTLDDMETYPTITANDDLAAVIFKLYDTDKTTYTVSGNSTSSSQTISISNPFITTTAQALTAARSILGFYGGNRLELSVRGDPASELGDVDRVELDVSSATSARRISQGLNFSDGVMSGLPVTLLQADGSFLYQTREKLTGTGTWTGPAGVTSIRCIIVGGGDGGTDGSAGDWSEDGEEGSDGKGGKITVTTVSINKGQSISYNCGSGGASNGGSGEASVFGELTSATGQRFDGYSDIANGDVYGRDGVASPLSGSGDGGAGGAAGRKGVSHTESIPTVDANGNLTDSETERTVVDSYPTAGGSGAAGASGCIIIYYDKAVS